MGRVILEESHYKEKMEELVEPFLTAVKSERTYEREQGNHIYCRCYKADKAKGVVLISHGFTESAEKYKEIIYYFLKARYHVWMPEHCGHGNSYRLTEDWSLVHVDDYRRYVDDLLYIGTECGKVHESLPMILYGHSMGGGIALAAAAREPGMFQKIVASSPMVRPSVGLFPWNFVRVLAFAACKVGKDREYVPAHNPYSGPGEFEKSSSTSRARFDFYQEKRAGDKKLWMNAPSFGWLRQADLLNRYLQNSAWKKIQSPVLLVQAGKDVVVSNREQNRFMRKLNRKTPGLGNKTVIPKAKHEIFGSDSRTAEQYWKRIFWFLN